jgi:hypothetical protein
MSAIVALMVVVAMRFLSVPAAAGSRLFAHSPSSDAIVTAPASQTTIAPTTAESASARSKTAAQNTPEMTSEESPTTFKVNVPLVQVHVVVRDARGKAICTLKKDDFKIFDNGKLQVISGFDVEKPGQRVAEAETSSESSSAPTTVTAGSSALPSVPERYIAYFFDDIHLENTDLIAVREAAQKNLATLQTTDRAAIFTTSGQNELDFTDDQNKLREALNHLRTHSISDDPRTQCPRMFYYMADRIQNQDDQRALEAVTEDALDCAFGGDSKFRKMAEHSVCAETGIGCTN